jgi:hypothetical protein
MKEILLTKGKVALVDDEDFEELSKHKWYCSDRDYAARHGAGHNRRHIYMHREIMHTPPGMVTDHINHNKLDNRKSNLRVCTDLQNARNSTYRPNNTSGFKGVSLRKKYGTWSADIKINYFHKFLGYFSSPEEAAHAYDNAAKEIYGEFAKTNF